MTPAVAGAAIEEAADEARVFAAKAAEAVQEGVHAARRSYRLAKRRAEDAADDATACIRKQPLTAVGVAFVAGLAIGAASGFVAVVIGRRFARFRT